MHASREAKGDAAVRAAVDAIGRAGRDESDDDEFDRGTPTEMPPNMRIPPAAWSSAYGTVDISAALSTTAHPVSFIPHYLVPLALSSFSSCLERISAGPTIADTDAATALALWARDGLGLLLSSGGGAKTKRRNNIVHRQLHALAAGRFVEARARALARDAKSLSAADAPRDAARGPRSPIPAPDPDAPASPPSLPARTARRFKSLAGVGKFRRAADCLTPEEPAIYSEQTFATLTALHPPLPVPSIYPWQGP